MCVQGELYVPFVSSASGWPHYGQKRGIVWRKRLDRYTSSVLQAYTSLPVTKKRKIDVVKFEDQEEASSTNEEDELTSYLHTRPPTDVNVLFRRSQWSK